MGNRSQRWIDFTGLNLIRVVIGSYFMAIALGLIQGVDQTALFVSFLDFQTADLVGTTLMFAATMAFMVGVYLRLTSLVLAIFVLASSLAQNFLHFDTASVSNFWRDLTLVCAVLLSYSSLRRGELRKAVIGGRYRFVPARKSDKDVMPRRVVPTERKTSRKPRNNDYQKTLEPLIASRPAAPAVKLSVAELPRKSVGPADDEDFDNIFASI